MPLDSVPCGSQQQTTALTPNWGEIAERRPPRLTPLARQLPAGWDRGHGWVSELQAEALVLRAPNSLAFWDPTASGSGLPVTT